MNDQVINRLLHSDEPSVRYRVLVQVLGQAWPVGQDPQSPEAVALRDRIPASPRVQRLLAGRDATGRIPGHPYSKWSGAHWVLAALADLHYPPGDGSLFPLRDQVLDWLLGEGHLNSIRTIDGRVRRCASQEGNALYAMLALGLDDERAGELARRLDAWHWPDGGWNCDKNPAAAHSSFMESLIPLRGLALHARLAGDPRSQQAARRAAEVFMTRRLFRRRSDGGVMRAEFVRLQYPCYWHYDILFGLKVMAEAGFLGDERCRDALDLLAAKQLPGGGFPAEHKYYQTTRADRSGYSPVDWGGAGKRRMNEWVTVDALAVLKQAGRVEDLGASRAA